MSQKPGQAPHIFTPNTDPTAVENNPVGGAEAVSAAAKRCGEIVTPGTPHPAFKGDDGTKAIERLLSYYARTQSLA